MSLLVPLTLFGWVPVALLLFALMPPRRAIIVAYLVAWLFLPVAEYKIPGLPDYGKMTATSYGILLAVILFDSNALLSFRPSRWDAPFLVYCFCGMAASISNGLGVYDGLSVTVGRVVSWGLPYLFGRVYLSDPSGLRDLAIGLMVGGVLYVPLCLFEMRFSPQLHHMVYGYHAHSWGQVKRWGGYRPTVFMQHGLAVALWMAVTAVTGVWLWMSGVVRKLRGLHIGWYVVPLVVTAAMCKSGGALVEMILFLAACYLVKVTRTTWLVAVLIAVVPTYMVVRATGLWSGMQAVELSDRIFSEERGGSLEMRMRNENALAAKAMERPILGWGGWSRSQIHNEKGVNVSVTDGFWIIVLGHDGILGLVSVTLAMLLPAITLWWRYPGRMWMEPWLAPAAVLAMVLVMFMIDNLANAMLNPVFTLAAGALTGFCAKPFQIRPPLRQTAASSDGPAPRPPRYFAVTPRAR